MLVEQTPLVARIALAHSAAIMTATVIPLAPLRLRALIARAGIPVNRTTRFVPESIREASQSNSDLRAANPAQRLQNHPGSHPDHRTGRPGRPQHWLDANSYIGKPIDLDHVVAVAKIIRDFRLETVKLPRTGEYGQRTNRSTAYRR